MTPNVFNSELESCRQKLVNNVQTPLHHAIRFVVRPDDESNGDLRKSWHEFLPDEKPFEFARVQIDGNGPVFHSCFYGSRKSLKSFNGLAARIAHSFPISWPEGRRPDLWARDAIRDRDSWMLAVYELISQRIYSDLMIPMQSSPTGSGDFDPVSFVGLTGQRIQEAFARWCGAKEEFDELPKYVYVSPSVNVFKVSFDVIKYAQSHPKEFGTDCPDIVDLTTDAGMIADKSNQMPDVDLVPSKEKRDEYIYRAMVNRLSNQDIMDEICRNKSWAPISSRTWIRQTAMNYAKRHNLPKPLPRKRGRPKT